MLEYFSLLFACRIFPFPQYLVGVFDFAAYSFPSIFFFRMTNDALKEVEKAFGIFSIDIEIPRVRSHTVAIHYVQNHSKMIAFVSRGEFPTKFQEYQQNTNEQYCDILRIESKNKRNSEEYFCCENCPLTKYAMYVNSIFQYLNNRLSHEIGFWISICSFVCASFSNEGVETNKKKAPPINWHQYQ